MKWFKHLSGSLSDEFIIDLMDEFGDAGYVMFFGILEIMADEFNIEKPGELTTTWKVLRRKLRKNRGIVERFLNYSSGMVNRRQSKPVFVVSMNGEGVTIKCPKFIRYVDEYTRKQIGGKLRTNSGQTPEQKQKQNKEKEKRKRKAPNPDNRPPSDQATPSGWPNANNGAKGNLPSWGWNKSEMVVCPNCNFQVTPIGSDVPFCPECREEIILKAVEG